MTRWGELVDIRPWDPARAGERSLVVDSWARSWAPHAQPPMPATYAGPIVEAHLGDCDLVLVATIPSVDRVVCGWLARARRGVLGYLYVLHDYRRRGIGERLMCEADMDPRGARWRYVFATPRLRRLCRPDPKRPERTPWRGVPDGKGSEGREARRDGHARGA